MYSIVLLFFILNFLKSEATMAIFTPCNFKLIVILLKFFVFFYSSIHHFTVLFMNRMTWYKSMYRKEIQ